MDCAWRRKESLGRGIGVSSPSAAGVSGCVGRGGITGEVAPCLELGRLSSLVSSEGKETEGEGGITVTFRLEPPSDGMSSGVVPLPVVGDRSRAGDSKIWAGAGFFCTDGFLEWLCRGDVSPEDAFVLFPDLVSFAKKPGAIFFSLFRFLYFSARPK